MCEASSGTTASDTVNLPVIGTAGMSGIPVGALGAMPVDASGAPMNAVNMNLNVN
eukprot:CAMPEP_0185775808 /NCGR_PEP_ID=MMETSP1174-20130828/83363_1 /TAXON_ID=35687 /ORGANISM="Dictyocha speculum, Strain CCMP1381" /LENGTH=54 /DNA_ID=CAMNT_0028463503 /DNA_START=1 /DNA_END=162 /DNA_ORIENTATION=-